MPLGPDPTLVHSPSPSSQTVRFTSQPSRQRTDATYEFALWLSGAFLLFQEYAAWALPYLFVLLLGFSLSLSLAGLLLPSAGEPIAEHSRLLDSVFNVTYYDFLHYGSPCNRDVPPLSTWADWVFGRVSTRSFDVDCEPMAYCFPAFQRLVPSLLPSNLAVRINTPLRVVSFRIRLERLVCSLSAAAWSQFAVVRSRAITFVTDHALALFVCYMCFPSKAILSCLKLLTRVPRSPPS